MIFTRAILALLLAVAAYGQQVTIRVLATTDLHGNIYPYDYFTGQPAARGLAKIATLITQERASNPNAILVDCGDTIQGSPLEFVHQAFVHQTAVRGGATEPDPMMLVMNRLGYDAMAVGNHEYNYGMNNLEAARRAARFPYLSANTEGWPGVRPYTIKTVAGVRIAIIGATTPAIPFWEKAENYAGVRFTDPVAAVRKIATDLRRNNSADVIVIIVHSGLDRDVKTGRKITRDLENENVAYQLATEVPGVDAVIFGHTHSELVSYSAGGVAMMQPRNWGMSLGEMDLTLDKQGGSWKVTNKSNRVIPVRSETPADAAVLALAKPYHDAAEAYLNKVVAESDAPLTTAMARVEDNALIDAIQAVQLDATGADVSFASAFSLRVSVPKGPLTVRQLAGLYLYDNTLYTLQGNGRMVREALENSARFYRTCADDCSKGPLINPDIAGFNYDMAQGVDYEIDLRRPPGQRIVNLRWKGKPLADDQPLKLAVNHYRAAGSAGYTMFPGAKILWRSNDEIRDMMVQYFSGKHTLPVQPDHNWSVIPPAAAETLRHEAQRE